MTTMRKEWFNFVAQTRKKLQRKTKEPVSHRAAMKEASLVWPKEKAKILNRRKREERKRAKEKAATQNQASKTVKTVRSEAEKSPPK